MDETTQTNEEELLNAHQVCTELGIDPKAISVLTKANLLVPSYRGESHTLYFTRSAVEAFKQKPFGVHVVCALLGRKLETIKQQRQTGLLKPSGRIGHSDIFYWSNIEAYRKVKRPAHRPRKAKPENAN